jgi:serine/threonine-protein kinase
VRNDLGGYPVSRATADLEALCLRPGTQEDPGCAATQPPTVTVMSVGPGEVPIHSEVVLTYCSGP